MGSGQLIRIGVSFGLVLAGVTAVEWVAGMAGWLWIGLALVGLVGGSVAGRPRDAWLGGIAAVAGDAVANALGAEAVRGVFWPLLVTAHAGVVALAFVAGTAVDWRRRRLSRRWRLALAVAVAVCLVALGGWSVALGAMFSETYITQEANAVHDCRTPGLRFGWTYEAVNYDQADDARLLGAMPDPTRCTAQFVSSQAGMEVVSRDGTRIAGWYIPAENPAVGPAGPTLVLVHGGKSNKSGMLDYASPLHRDYNLVLVDLRNTGRSGGKLSSGGLHEQDDVRALVDWVERTKHPRWLGLVANSNGAATGLAEAVHDSRIRVLVLDSMHARIVSQLGNIAETELAPLIPAWPGAMAVIAGASWRVGGDIQSVDPIRTLPQVGGRPVLLTHGSMDHVDTLAGALVPNTQAALAAGVDVTVHVCLGADHGQVIVNCRDQWGQWVTSFLDEVRARH